MAIDNLGDGFLSFPDAPDSDWSAMNMRLQQIGRMRPRDGFTFSVTKGVVAPTCMNALGMMRNLAATLDRLHPRELANVLPCAFDPRRGPVSHVLEETGDYDEGVMTLRPHRPITEQPWAWGKRAVPARN